MAAYFYDEEYERARNTPGLSQATLDLLAERTDERKRRDATVVLEGAATTRARTADRASALIEEAESLAQQVRETEGRMLTYRTTAEDAQKVLAGARQRVRELTKLAVDLRNQEADQDRVKADPLAEADRLFARYPALQANRPSIFE